MNDVNHQKIFKGDVWHCYGGHRLWASPENVYTYAPDNQPVQVKLIGNKLFLEAPTLPVVNLKMKWQISIHSDNLEIKHTIVNQSNKVITLAAWALTQMAPKGVAIFKFNEHNTGFLPNRKMILWPYTNLSDSRLFLGNKYFSLNMDPKKHAPIKLGLDNHIAKAAYLLNGYKFTIFHSHNHPGCYPDGGASLETYTNQHFLEIETLSKLMKLRPKNSITHVEKWRIDRIPFKFKKIKSDEVLDKLFNVN